MEKVKSMRILQVTRTFGRTGGVEHVAFELQRGWREAGIDTRVLTAIVRDERDKVEAELVVPWLKRVATAGRSGYLGKILAVPVFTLAATRHLRCIRQDRLVVSHGDTLAGDVCVIHAVNKASLVEKWRSGSWIWIFNPMNLWVGLRDRRMISGLRYRCYVAISSRVAEELRRLHHVPMSRIAVIPNGVNIERFHPNVGDRAGVRREFMIPDAAPLLLFVGHEFERKGLSTIIRAMARLRPDVYLLVVGNGISGPYRAMAQQAGIAAGHVIFAGGRQDLPRVYPAADAFVFPTYYEAFPLVCIEAMAAGLPLFATRVGGIEDYLKEGVNGSFITRDPEDLAAQLQPVLADPALRRRLSLGARATAEEYAWPKIAARYLDLLRSLQHERDRVVAA